MIRCTRCIYPTTRPDAHFDDEGVCSGCRSFEARKAIDWDKRDDALCELIEEAKARKAPYDVVVPVSGGKDSTAQVLKMLDLDAKVLAVNGATDYLTERGRRNLDNIKRFCDVIEVTPRLDVRKKLVRIGLYRVGDMSWPEHNIIWSAPTRIAAQMAIPLVVWGEQPQREYANPEGVEPATNLDGAWVAQFGGMGSLRLDDLVGEQSISASDLEIFRFPSASALDCAAVRGIWLSEYMDWDGWKNAFVAQHYGFEMSPWPVETSLGNYENLDNYVTILRDWLRFVKFGYGRATDIASNHIRRGRLTREEALALIAKAERFPRFSLGKPIAEVLAHFDLTVDEFVTQCDRWTNPAIFRVFDSNVDNSRSVDKDGDGTPCFRKPNGASHAHHTSPAQ